MNFRRLISGALLAFVVVTAAACSDDDDDNNGLPYLEVSPSVLRFDADGTPVGEARFTVRSNRDWTVEVTADGDWLTPSVVSGSGSGYIGITVPASAADRIATLSVSLRNGSEVYLTRDVTVEQGDAPEAGAVSALVAYIRSTWPDLETGTEALGYAEQTVEAVILANNEGGNNFGKLYVGDNITLPNSAIVLYDTAEFTQANSANYPVGKRVTLDLSQAEYAPYHGLRELKNVGILLSQEDPVTVVVPTISAAVFNEGGYQGQYVRVTDLTPQASFVGEMWAANSKRTVGFDASGEGVVQSYMAAASDIPEFADLRIADRTGSLLGAAEQYGEQVQIVPTRVSDVAAFVASDAAPEITEVAPDLLSWSAEDVAPKTLAVSGRNLEGRALTVNGGETAPFTATADGLTVTVVPEQANASAENIVRTLVLSVEGGNSVEVPLIHLAAGADADMQGIFVSMSQFIPAASNTEERCYPSFSTIDGRSATGFKLGTGSFSGVFTSEPLGASCTGDRKLSFYAVAWNGHGATIHVRVDGGGSVSGAWSRALRGNAGAAGSGNDFTLTGVDGEDYCTFSLTGLTAASTVTVSTSADFKAAEDDDTGRAVVLGVQVY